MKVDKGTTKIEKEAQRLAKRFKFVAITIGVLGAIQLSNMALDWLQSKEIRPMYVISLKDQSLTLQTPLREQTESDRKLKSPIPLVNAGDTKNNPIASPTPWPKNPNSQQIADYIKTKKWDSHIAIPLAKSENFWNKTKSFDCSRTNTNTDGSVDVGIFQINSYAHARTLSKLGMTIEDMKDCYKNINFAFEHIYIYSGFGPWSAFQNGSWMAHDEQV